MIKRLVFSIIAIIIPLLGFAQNTLPLLKEGTRVSIPLNKKNTKGLDIFIKSMTFQDSTEYSCQANIILELTSRNEKIHFGQYQDKLGGWHSDYMFNLFSIDDVLEKNKTIEKEVSIRVKSGYYRDSLLLLSKRELMYLPPYDPEEFIKKEEARKKAIEFANKARQDSIFNARFGTSAQTAAKSDSQEKCEKLLTPEYLANWVGASFFTKESIENDCEVYPSAYSGGKVFYNFPKCPVTMEFTEDKQVCIYLSFRLFGEDGYNFRKELINYGYKLRSKSDALVAENNFGDLTNGKVSIYKCALKYGGYSVCQITEGQAFMFEFYRSKK